MAVCDHKLLLLWLEFEPHSLDPVTALWHSSPLSWSPCSLPSRDGLLWSCWCSSSLSSSLPSCDPLLLQSLPSSSWSEVCSELSPPFSWPLSAGGRLGRGVVSHIFSSLDATRKLRVVTTSLIKGRTDASSWRHIAAIATAWFRLFSGNRLLRRGSAISGNFLGSLNLGCACSNSGITHRISRKWEIKLADCDEINGKMYPRNEILLIHWPSRVDGFSTGDEL